MIERMASAPGKAVIAGEYAVLAGAPAISMAMNRRARVRIVAVENSVSRVSAPGYIEGSFRFRTTAEAGIAWLDELPEAASLKLFEAVWKRSATGHTGGLSIVLDTTEFFDAESGRKLGLGSSAALASALTAALAVSKSHCSDNAALAGAAHREFQGGTGSGIDIATAADGGLIRFQAGEPTLQLPWPAGMKYRLLWSGVAASTTDKLQQLENQTSQNGWGRLIAVAGDVADAWQTGDCGSVLSELRRYVTALQEFGIDHNLGIFEAGHQELVARAEFYPNTVYKPCGAGGGDIGIVLAESQKDVDRFASEASGLGFVPLDIALDPDGVRVDENVS